MPTLTQPDFPGRHRLPEIEVLRAVAILITLVAHLNLLFAWKPAWFQVLASNTALGGGVDLFFCISGYVIASSFVARPAGRSWQDFKAVAVPFWIKRIWRLWPSATLWLMVYLGASLFFNNSGSFGSFFNTATGTLAALLQVANFNFAACAEAKNCGSSVIYWSLSLEEQFYLVFPFVVVFLSRSRLKFVLVALVLVQIALHRPPPGLLWNIRTDAIALGVLLAVTPETIALLKQLTGRIGVFRAILLPALCLALILLPTGPLRDYPGVAALVSVLLVALAALDQAVLIKPGRVRAALIYLGTRSYAIYLCHEAVFFAVREGYFRINGWQLPGAEQTAAFSAAAAVLILLTADLNFRFVERPLREHGARLAAAYRTRPSATNDQPVPTAPAGL